ncbi:MAG: hypothetical protein AB9866_28725 [Syntrophobacteraceae bacterium]
MSGGLIWYAACTYAISARMPGFSGSASSRVFPVALLSGGHSSYYSALDPSAASRSYRDAIIAAPALADAWISLAKVELAMGHREEARRIIRIISPPISSVSSWKWQELLLAFDLEDEQHFKKCFNFILDHIPHRIHEAGLLGLRFWGSWEAVVPHLATQNDHLVLNELMIARQPAVALALWRSMEESNPVIDPKITLPFCQFLIENGFLSEAKLVWQRYTQNDLLSIYDGGFEVVPLNTAFGWRFSNSPEMIIERSPESPHSGSRSLRLHFKGNKNWNFSHVSQIIPVQPGGNYTLRFFRKSRDLTTDQGIFLQVSGYKCNGLQVRSEAVLGTTPWVNEELKFAVPECCETVILKVLRNESLKMDSKISGEYWIDAVELIEK